MFLFVKALIGVSSLYVWGGSLTETVPTLNEKVQSTESREGASVTFEEDIRPILREHCVMCHKEENLADPVISGALALDSFESVLKGVRGDTSRRVVYPGKSQNSRLVSILLEQDDVLRMPLDAEPLPATEIETIIRWIDLGARRGSKREKTGDFPNPVPSKASLRVIDLRFPLTVVPVDTGLSKNIDQEKVQLIASIGPLSPVTALAYSPDGKSLVVGRYGKLSVWDAHRGVVKQIVTSPLKGALHDLVFSKQKSLLAAAGGLPARQGQTLLLDTGSWEVLHDLSGHRDVVFAAAFSSDGKRLASGSFDKTVMLWDMETREVMATIETHSDFVYDVAFSPDGKVLASASKDRTIKLSDGINGKSIRTLSGHDKDVFSIAITADGKNVISTGVEPQLRWWSLEDGSVRRRSEGHGSSVHQVTVSSDGKFLVTASSDGTLRLWDAQKGTLKQTFSSGSEWMYSVALRPDGKHIAGGTWDGLVKIWDVNSGDLIAILVEPPPRISSRADYLVLTHSGYYQMSEGLLPMVRAEFGGQLLESGAFHKTLNRHDRVQQILNGRSVETPRFSVKK